MAADDREVLREVWEARIPICFSISEDEGMSENLEPCFLLVSRLTYITLISEKVLKHFKMSLQDISKGEEIWFEYNDQPLKWHYPVGVLYDLLAHGTSLPWNVKVHFTSFPEEELLHCERKEVVEAHYMSCIKEADVLKHRGQIINNMQKRDHKQLWNGLQNDKFDQFWTINRRLMERTNEEPFKSVPFRLYQPDKMYIQKLFKPVTDNGEPLCLSHLMHKILPDQFEDWNHEDSSNQVLIHGIAVPMETPVQWLSEHLSHPDNFLHLVMLPKIVPVDHA